MGEVKREAHGFVGFSGKVEREPKEDARPRHGDVYRPRLGGVKLTIDSFDSKCQSPGVWRYGDGDGDVITGNALDELYVRVARLEPPVSDEYAIAHYRARIAKVSDPARLAKAVETVVRSTGEEWGRWKGFDEMVAACIAYDKASPSVVRGSDVRGGDVSEAGEALRRIASEANRVAGGSGVPGEASAANTSRPWCGGRVEEKTYIHFADGEVTECRVDHKRLAAEQARDVGRSFLADKIPPVSQNGPGAEQVVAGLLLALDSLLGP